MAEPDKKPIADDETQEVVVRKSFISEFSGTILLLLGAMILLALLSFEERQIIDGKLQPISNIVGTVGHYAARLFHFLFGHAAHLLGPYLALMGLVYIARDRVEDPLPRIAAALLLLVGLSILIFLFSDGKAGTYWSQGGVIGRRAGQALQSLFGFYGAVILSAGLLATGLFLGTRLPLSELSRRLRSFADRETIVRRGKRKSPAPAPHESAGMNAGMNAGNVAGLVAGAGVIGAGVAGAGMLGAGVAPGMSPGTEAGTGSDARERKTSGNDSANREKVMSEDENASEEPFLVKRREEELPWVSRGAGFVSPLPSALEQETPAAPPANSDAETDRERFVEKARESAQSKLLLSGQARSLNDMLRRLEEKHASSPGGREATPFSFQGRFNSDESLFYFGGEEPRTPDFDLERNHTSQALLERTAEAPEPVRDMPRGIASSEPDLIPSGPLLSSLQLNPGTKHAPRPLDLPSALDNSRNLSESDSEEDPDSLGATESIPTGVSNFESERVSDFESESETENEAHENCAAPDLDANATAEADMDLDANATADIDSDIDADMEENEPFRPAVDSGWTPSASRVPPFRLMGGTYRLGVEALSPPRPRDHGAVSKEIETTRSRLEIVLKDYGIQAKVTRMQRGPIVTLYEIKLEPGVKVSRVLGIQDEIKMNLEAPSVRILAPLPGKATVGIEIPNQSRDVVVMGDIIRHDPEFFSRDRELSVALGKDIEGKNNYVDLTRLPHLLLAGATGAGKSVFMNSMIASLLYTRSPLDVRFIMIDPKLVELSLYEGIPHLLMPVITDVRRASRALNWAVQEMEDRYALLSNLKCRDIRSYNQRLRKEGRSEKMPYIVILIDELSDLMMIAAKDVEDSIIRLTQKARAVGIHVVMATQRPSVDVITALIKANSPARIAFQVAQRTDSRTILDANGAETLVGQGDMLYKSPYASGLERLQAPLVTESEIEKIVGQAARFGEPSYVDLPGEDSPSGRSESDSEIDQELFMQAWDIVLETGKTSTSYIQRRLRIGYNRAARIIELMEEKGYLGPLNGSKPREILKKA